MTILPTVYASYWKRWIIERTVGMLFTDRAEAVGNIETGLVAVLNAFHSLYDAIESQLGRPLIDWFAFWRMASILAIRNARHHNHCNKIRTLYTYHARDGAPGPNESYTLKYPLFIQ